MANTNSAIAEPELDLLVSELNTAESKQEYFDQVHRIFDIYGLGHGCLHTLGNAYSPAEALWRVTPDDVTAACSYLVTANKHPAIILGKKRHFAFDMFEFRHHFDGDPDVEALFDAFEANGLKHAYGLPINTREHGSFVFVIARPGDAIETVELLTLQAICTNAVNGVKQFEKRPCEANKESKLTNKEKRLLISLAKGNSVTHLANTLKLSETTIQLLISSLVLKLNGQNISHAIVLALIEGEIGLAECRPDY
ncbi:MAG: LuxR C-terminal-related transcriptional regulator [Pseudomonadota bacterium]